MTYERPRTHDRPGSRPAADGDDARSQDPRAETRATIVVEPAETDRIGEAIGEPLGELRGGLIDQLMEEAVALAEEARAMVQSGAGPLDAARPFDRLVASGELSRVTARVGHCVSWLLARRAVLAGELQAGDPALDELRLDGHEVCLAASEHHDRLTRPLLALLARSEALYHRVSRLDRSLDRAPEAAPEASGAPRPDGPFLRLV